MEYNKYDYWLEMAQYDFETAIADKLFLELTETRCAALLSNTEVLYKWIIDKFMK